MRTDQIALQMYTDLVQQLQLSDRYSEAMQRMRAQLQLFPQDVKLHFRQAMLLWRWMTTKTSTDEMENVKLQRHLEESRELEERLLSVLRLQPNMPEALFNLALLQHRQGRLHESMNTLQSLLHNRPDHEKARVLWCASIHEIGKNQRKKMNETIWGSTCPD